MKSFTTNDVNDREIVPFWHDVICKTYVPIDCRFEIGPDFKAKMSLKRYGRTDLSHIISQAAQYERNEQHIRKSDNDDYLVTLMTKGQTIVEQMDRSCKIGPGDLCLLDTARPYRFDYPLPYQAIHLKVPRDELDRRLPDAGTVAASRVAGGGSYARLAATMLQSTVELLADDTNAPRQIEPTLLDLIALAFDESFADQDKSSDRYAQIVTRAQTIISERLFDPGFDISNVPMAIGVSSRSLYRAFAQQGSTPARYLATKRLEVARDMILSARFSSVSEVAMACGFNEFSHFSRAFKTHFGITPRDMMEQARHTRFGSQSH